MSDSKQNETPQSMSEMQNMHIMNFEKDKSLQNSDPSGLKPLMLGMVGSIHISKSRVSMLGASPHESNIPTVAADHDKELPGYFSWIDNRSLFNPECPRFPMPQGYNYCDKIAVPPLPNNISTFVLPPINQSECGNCYAVSSANVTAARFAVWGLQHPSRLSYFQLTDCSSLISKNSESGCGGGNAADCFYYMNQYGVMTAKQYTDQMVKTGKYPEGPNGKWPAGQASFKEDSFVEAPKGHEGPWPMTPDPLPKLCKPKVGDGYPYKTTNLGTSVDYIPKVQQLTSIESIKSEIFNNGPVVAMYKCWDDFIYPTMSNMHLWPETNNIYIRGAYQSRSAFTIEDFIKHWNIILNVNFKDEDVETYRKSFWVQTHPADQPYVPSEFNTWWKTYWSQSQNTMRTKPTQESDSNVMGHSVMIVGWGFDNVPDYGKIEYWIVQNSWGNEWNDNGYFKIAMSRQKNSSGEYVLMPDPNREGSYVNQGVGIDFMTDDSYGGVFGWRPLIVDGNNTPINMPKMPVDENGKPIPLVTSPDPCETPASPSSPDYPVVPLSPSSPDSYYPVTPSPPSPPSPSYPDKPGSPLWKFPSMPFFEPSKPPAQPPAQPPSQPPPSPSPVQPPSQPPSQPQPLYDVVSSPSPSPPSPPTQLPQKNETETETSSSWFKKLNPLEIAAISVVGFILIGILVWVTYTWISQKQSQSSQPSSSSATELQPLNTSTSSASVPNITSTLPVQIMSPPSEFPAAPMQ